MAITAVATRKSFSFQGVTQEYFSNVYHYFSAANLDVTMATDLANQIVTAEKLCHCAAVQFEDVRVWSAGGTPGANQTIVIVDVSGFGSMVAGNTMARELAVVVRCDTNRNTSTGRRIYLRKYYHSTGLVSGTDPQVEQYGALTSTQKAPFQTCLETLREVALTGGINVQLCAPGGQVVSDTRPVTVLDYVRTRQLHQ